MSPAFQIFNFEENFMLGNLDQFSFKVPLAHSPPPSPHGAYVGSLSYFIMLKAYHHDIRVCKTSFQNKIGL